ncbi:hypothetical protein AVEN_227088-1 [Araneus ventricosus]|uniref:Uncharacterized protein n=1 Tax=Araneus ventricosus TaxID=182803 RepID=A0A4Y2BU90_ARAVE|nr:hypothetical protein AVEN_227088-1 [Araneus ventricosus]
MSINLLFAAHGMEWKGDMPIEFIRYSALLMGAEKFSHHSVHVIANNLAAVESLASQDHFSKRKIQEVERNSPKINVWCALLHDTAIGPFFFAETSVTANIYLNMLQSYAIPQMQHLQPTIIFQQDAEARMFEHFAGTGLPVGYPQVTKGADLEVH